MTKKHESKPHANPSTQNVKYYPDKTTHDVWKQPKGRFTRQGMPPSSRAFSPRSAYSPKFRKAI